MPAYTASQKAAIQQYSALTQADKTSSAKALRQYDWDVQAAANAYFSGGANHATTGTHKPKLNKLFDQYRDSPQDTPDEINMEGTMKLMEALGIDIESVDMLVFSELVACPSLGTVTREGFVDSLASEGVSDPSKIATLVSSRRQSLPSDPALIKKVYRHTFIIARAAGQKAVALDAATEYWRVLLSSPSLAWRSKDTPWLDWWLEFLTERYKKSVNKDLWDQTLVFAQRTLEDESMGFWSEDAAWPGVIDEFVEFVKEKRGGGESMDTS
ncbi:hypothetical protein K461DRAFT_262261 [Myriangium duriaei CBS 260.36]|uniref:Defective in cullin neddylation protein n=1 Tax=Myriangium duriaei CBS 260.36 TaxID=1168546 RepID=A0A9P4IWP1_9PEZI|nr:hypothetical protein K461DRAFT_262261 [Myriangium duriaei CBS 260.36]